MQQGWSELVARGRLPEPRRLVIAPRQHGLAVRAEGHRLYLVLMLQGWSERLTRAYFPEPRRLVMAPRQHGPTVRAEGHGPNSALVRKNVLQSMRFLEPTPQVQAKGILQRPILQGNHFGQQARRAEHAEGRVFLGLLE